MPSAGTSSAPAQQTAPAPRCWRVTSTPAGEGLGPLAGLGDIDRGAEIELTAADGTSRGYRVAEVAVIRKARLPLERIFARGGTETLIVITCGGPYDLQTGYRDNVVLTARPAG
jgi:hypothetical protein